MSTPIELTIPGWLKKKIVISDDEICYGSTKLAIKDLSRISYHSTTTRTSIYFIPVNTSTTSSFYIGTDSAAISINIPGGSTEPNKVFNQLFFLSKKFFEPIIVKRLFLLILGGGTIRMGGLSLNRDGFNKKTLFRGLVVVPWHQFAGSDLQSAVVHVWYLTERNAKQEFISIPLAITNAAVLSELMNQCHNEFAKYAARGIRMCTFCGKETESDGKFCQHCGTSLPSKH
ncbi:MAG: zinc ribbon domain-containing protein [Candidatus Peribacteraceae bacterium]|nr:zinc ribbon domain-containing protein [Candidatus Peribacteraceae bacterium]